MQTKPGVQRSATPGHRTPPSSSPNGATESVAPLGFGVFSVAVQGLAPLTIDCRPSGAEDTTPLTPPPALKDRAAPSPRRRPSERPQAPSPRPRQVHRQPDGQGA